MGDSTKYSLTGGATVVVGPDGGRVEGARNGLTGDETDVRGPERVLSGRQTLTGNRVWTNPHTGVLTATVTAPLPTVPNGVMTVKVYVPGGTAAATARVRDRLVSVAPAWRMPVMPAWENVTLVAWSSPVPVMVAGTFMPWAIAIGAMLVMVGGPSTPNG